MPLYRYDQKYQGWTMKRKLLLGVLLIAIVGFAAAGVTSARNTKDRLEFNKIQLNNRASEIKLEQLKSKELYDKLNSNDAKTQQQIDQYKKQLEESQQREKDLQDQLQAKIDTKNRLARAQQSLTATATASAAPVSPNWAKAFIYGKESGNRTDAINASSGACGLGQALPCSKMPCTLQDYACQDAFFTNYAVNRYGSWENAAAFWQAHSWW